MNNMHIHNEHKLKYLGRRISEIEELKQCLKNDEFEVAVNIGHKLKGNGETFGFPAISAIGLRIENSAFLKDKEMLSLAIEDLASNVEQNLKSIH